MSKNSNFKERFRDKSETVGKDGQRQQQQQQTAPQQQQQQQYAPQHVPSPAQQQQMYLQQQQQQQQPNFNQQNPYGQQPLLGQQPYNAAQMNPYGQPGGGMLPPGLLPPIGQPPMGQLPPWLQQPNGLMTPTPTQPQQQQQQPPNFLAQDPSQSPYGQPNDTSAQQQLPSGQQQQPANQNGGSNLANIPRVGGVDKLKQQGPPPSNKRATSFFDRSPSPNDRRDSSDDFSPSSLPKKPPLPDFSEAAIEHGRRKNQFDQRREAKGGPVDHPTMGNYKARTMEDYHKIQERYTKHHWGGLGMNDTDEARKEREKRKKILEYSKQVNAVNFAVMDMLQGDEWHGRPIEKKLTEEAALAQAKRVRAMQYADHYRPKPSSKSPTKHNSPSKRSGSGHERDSSSSNVNSYDERANNDTTSAHRRHIDDSPQHRPHANTPQPGVGSSMTTAKNPKKEELELIDLQEKHRRDQEQIQRIKQQLAMM